MTADEFLALVDKHGHDIGWGYDRNENQIILAKDGRPIRELSGPGAPQVLDAAVGLCVAAIRLLRDFPPEAPWRAANLRNLLAAHLVQIRDALPESLRP